MSDNAQAVSLVIFPAPDPGCWVGSVSLMTLKAQNRKAERAAQAWGPEVAFPLSIAPRGAAPTPGLAACSMGLSAPQEEGFV